MVKYRDSEGYELSLKPIVVEMVNEDIAFEIGQCAGTDQGKYVLIWLKDNSGKWKILIDSNIYNVSESCRSHALTFFN